MPMSLLRSQIALGCVVVVLLASGCGQGVGPEDLVPTKQVKGRVLEVVSRNITEVETLRIRDASGEEWLFTSEGWVGFTPSHIREHQLFGQLMLVSYLEKEGKLVAVDVTASPG